MAPLSNKAKLRAANPCLPPHYLFDPLTNLSALSDELKLMASEDPSMFSHQQQRVVDKMMPIIGLFENGHFVAVAKCDECGKEGRWTCEAVPRDARVVFTKFRDRKWQASKKGCTCPQCRVKRKQPITEFKREPDPPMKPIAEALATAVAKTPHSEIPHHEIQAFREQAEGEEPVTDTIAPTDKARAAKRQAYALLLDHYDDEKKCYQGDWSDKRIADTVKISEAFVAKIREDDFGPAGPPPQLIDLKTRLTRLEGQLREKETQVLSAMDAIPQMQEEVKLLRDQLASLITAHGWAP